MKGNSVFINILDDKNLRYLESNGMKKYIRLLPMILYPYAYLIIMLIYIPIFSEKEYAFNILLVVGIIYNLYSLIIAIINAVQTAKGRYTAYQAAKMNWIIKGVQIPAYMFHFLVGMVGALMSVWGIGFVFWAILIDVLTIALTGINAMGCCMKLYKEGIISEGKTVLSILCSFIFCIDVAVAIILYAKVKRKEVQQSNGISYRSKIISRQGTRLC